MRFLNNIVMECAEVWRIQQASTDPRVQLLRRTGFYAYANFVIHHIILQEQAEAEAVKKANDSEAFPMRRRAFGDSKNGACQISQPTIFVEGMRIKLPRLLQRRQEIQRQAELLAVP